MTVQELIDKLMKVEDKNKQVEVSVFKYDKEFDEMEELEIEIEEVTGKGYKENHVILLAGCLK